ncbi:MAG: family 16 glycoside hydrolase [Roseimicrobium sp.]
MNRSLILAVLTALTSAAYSADAPAGFSPLFNGKDLSGWFGWGTKDPRELQAMTPEKLAEYKKTSVEGGSDAKGNPMTDHINAHWKVEGDEIVNDGKGLYLTTEKDYGDFELLVDYKMLPLGDSGIYLRGVPQVQIWDYTEEKKFPLGADKGSGGLWNNEKGTPGKDPLVKADKPFGEWNHFRIVMVGSRVSIWLNEQLVVDHVVLENYFDKKLPVELRRPVLPRGPIQLQTHGSEIRWRNVFIREIGGEEANALLASKGTDGYASIWNGKDFEGWSGPLENYEIVDGVIRCKDEKGGTIYWNETLTDFQARLEFKLPSGGNNGLAIRYPGKGDTAYTGMTELQVLDDNYDKVKGQIDPRQAHGSAYGMVAAARGYQRPIGEWNFQEVTVQGSTLKVELNGSVILDCDLSKVDMAAVMGGKPHPGKDRTSGFFGFAGHSDPVSFRNVQVRKLPATTTAASSKSVGLQLYSLRSQATLRGIPWVLDQVKALGITEVELAGTGNLTPEQLKAEVDQRGLKAVSSHFPYKRLKEDLAGVVRDAKLLGIQYAGCAWIDHKDAFDEAECRDAIATFSRAGEALAKEGITFFYHAHGYEFEKHGDGTLLDLLITETKPEQVSYQMDVLWIVFPGQDPVALLEKYGSRWKLMHLKDLRKGVATGSLSGKTELTNDVVLGTGQVDWPAVLQAAKKAGVQHYFIEDESPTVMEQLPQSLQFMKAQGFE